MRFVLDSLVYTVEISPRPIMFNGQPCKARIHVAKRRIYLSDQLPRDERRRQLFHELRHLWVMVRGAAEGAEADADQAAEMMDEVLQQYEQQGGDDALLALDPAAEKPQTRPGMITGPLANITAQCGACGVNVAVGSIANGKPEWSEDAGAWLMDRGMCCPACDRVTAWRESCSEAGMPLGAIVAFPPPRVLRGEEASRWMREHADLCSVHVHT